MRTFHPGVKARNVTEGVIGSARNATEGVPYRGVRIAFTLVELLVVIAIIGVLVALLLPAVQSQLTRDIDPEKPQVLDFELKVP